ncbi:MAG: hypothetical protein IKT16_07010 [Desulfovibrio sp.]|nr:hypothetical protein [Desulfovibrio sp.]
MEGVQRGLREAGAEPAAERAFRLLRERPSFADKSGMLPRLARLCLTEGRFVCISRPRGFGKSADACLLAAGFGPQGRVLLAGLEAERDSAFERFAGRYGAVLLDIKALLVASGGGEAFCALLVGEAAAGLGVPGASLACALKVACQRRQGGFVLVVDGWDAPLDGPLPDGPCRTRYLALLESLCQAREVWALACLFGEAPLERCPSLMARLPRFAAFSMRNPGILGPWTGLGEQAVRRICQERGLDFDELLAWHGGWTFDLAGRMFPPSAVAGYAETRRHRRFFAGSWANALLAELLAACPELGDVLALLAEGERVRIERGPGLEEGFGVPSLDACLLRLVHAGLVCFRLHTGEVFAPCLEVRLCLLEALAGGKMQCARATHLDVRQARS